MARPASRDRRGPPVTFPPTATLATGRSKRMRTGCPAATLSQRPATVATGARTESRSRRSWPSSQPERAGRLHDDVDGDLLAGRDREPGVSRPWCTRERDRLAVRARARARAGASRPAAARRRGRARTGRRPAWRPTTRAPPRPRRRRAGRAPPRRRSATGAAGPAASPGPPLRCGPRQLIEHARKDMTRLMPETTTAGAQFARALADKDFARARELRASRARVRRRRRGRSPRARGQRHRRSPGAGRLPTRARTGVGRGRASSASRPTATPTARTSGWRSSWPRSRSASTSASASRWSTSCASA